MIADVSQIYRQTRKKHDQLFNVFVARPLAAVVVAVLAPTRVTPNQVTLFNLAVFVVGSVLLIRQRTLAGGILAVAILEISYLFDCVDGMLARHKQLASKQGHLFDFFTDEIKAVMLTGSLALRLWQTGGYDLRGHLHTPGEPDFLVAGIAGIFVVASAISLTNFVRRPELSGQATTVEAHYEHASTTHQTTSLVGRVGSLGLTFLRFLAHYPSHLWLFALASSLDAFFWLYVVLHTLYLAKGWLGLLRRFGGFAINGK